MKKTLAPRILMVLALVVALVVLAAPVPRAGEYHDGPTLKCQECHVMHFSQSHRYDGTEFPGDAPYPEAPLGAVPTPKLLRDTANNLCLSCHNGEANIPDVSGVNSNGNVRAGGALTDGTAGYEDYNGHTLDVGTGEPAPGSGWANADGFKCVDCHDPHGYIPNGTNDVAGNPVLSQYRNLSATAGGSATMLGVSYTTGTDSTKDIILREYYTEDPLTSTVAQRYDVAVMDLYDPDTTNYDSGMGRWCGGCHGDFHGTAGDTNMGGSGGTGWLRHPTANADIGAINDGISDTTHSSTDTFDDHTYNVKVMDPAGLWDGTGIGLTPTCLSCHKAHGNQNPFGLIYMTGDTPITEEGDSTPTGLSDLCRQCHVQ